jgi:hypothetical protein
MRANPIAFFEHPATVRSTLLSELFFPLQGSNYRSSQEAGDGSDDAGGSQTVPGSRM